MATTVKVVARPAGIRGKTYLVAVVEGLWVTFRHLIKNWPGNMLGRRAKTDIATLSYPEENPTKCRQWVNVRPASSQKSKD